MLVQLDKEHAAYVCTLLANKNGMHAQVVLKEIRRAAEREASTEREIAKRNKDFPCVCDNCHERMSVADYRKHNCDTPESLAYEARHV